MQENVIIEFSADMSKLTPAIDVLEKMGVLSEEQVKGAKKAADEYKAWQDAIANKTRVAASELEKFARSMTDLPGQIAGGAIENTFKDMADAIRQVNPEAAKMINELGGIKNETDFVAQATKILYQQMAQLAAEGKKDTEEYKNLASAVSRLNKEMSELSAAPKPDVSPDDKSGEKIKSARTRLKELREEMMKMEDAGEVNTDAFRKLAEEAGNLTDQLGDTQQTIDYLASDTKVLDFLMGFGEGATGAFTAFTSGAAMVGGDMEELQAAFYKVQAALAVLNGTQKAFVAFGKNGAVIEGIRLMQSKMKTAAINAETGATVKLTVAQKIFNWVASLNPYILLFTGIGALVGAIIWLIATEDKATKAQIRNNEATKLQLEQQARRTEETKKAASEREHVIEHELEMMRIRGVSAGKIAQKERELAAERVKNAKDVAESLSRENGDLEKNKQKVEELEKALDDLNKAKIDGKRTTSVTINGEVKKVKVDDEKVRESIQGALDNFTAKVDVQLTADDALQKSEEEQQKLLAQQKEGAIQLAKERAKEELSILRQSQDAKIKLIKDEETRRATEVSIRFSREKEDLEKRRQELKKAGLLTAKANKEIDALIINSDKEKQNELDKLAAEFNKKRLDAIRESQDIELSLMSEGYEKRRAATETEYARRIQDLETRLKTEAGLSDEQRELINENIKNLKLKLDKEIAEIDRQDTIEGLKEKEQREVLSLEKRHSEELVELSKQHAKGLIKEEEYQKKKEELQRKYATGSINIEIDGINEQLKGVEKGSNEEKALLQQLAEARKKLAKEVAEAEIAENEYSTATRLEQEKKLKDALKELGSAAFDFANELAQMSFDNESARLDKQLADLDKYYTTDAEAAMKNKNLKLISEEELARRREGIEKQQTDNEKRAKRFQIISNAAQSAFSVISKALEAKATAALLLSNPVTAAYAPIALAQVAVIMAQLPMIAASSALQLAALNKYAKGRKGGRGEFALTGERGPEIMWIPDGASIIPSHKSKKLMEGMRIAGEYKVPFPKVPSFSNIDVAGIKEAQYISIDYDKFGRAVARNMPPNREIQQLNVNMDENGFSKFLTSKAGKTTLLNTRL